MLGKDRLVRIAQHVLGLSSADQTEVLIEGSDEQLTRFAANAIHQNVSETDVAVRVRAVFGKKVGVASSNDLGDEALRRLVDAAETVARLQQGPARAGGPHRARRSAGTLSELTGRATELSQKG